VTARAALWRGFRFGMLLQLAVGPVCLYVLQAASSGGFSAGAWASCGAALVDGLYISLALAGLSAFVGRQGVREALKIFGAAVLCLFGAALALSAFGIDILPGFGFAASGAGGSFLRAVAVTASNPLTILFWAGVFSSRVAEYGMGKAQAWLFGAGALLSTMVFLTLVAGLGSMAGAFLPEMAVSALNFIVGALLVFFGVKMIVRKRNQVKPGGYGAPPNVPT
jgi:threonine/homoserine/homoserine lactone efflux protein